jgi:asparagine synthase (glutamine-hydrolysing)
MCGIAGIIRFDNAPVTDSVLNSMTLALKHRGPDGHGVLSKNSVGIGHRRLSIIDLSGGSQPMTHDARGIWITYNGEIYNFKALRCELEKKAHRFITNSDTEVILRSYEEWGKECVNHFRGMFAFGIVDWQQQELFIARDHFGIKPLYYHLSKDVFVFSSEIQALFEVPEISAEIDLQAIDEYLCLQYVPSPRTGFVSVKKLSPAHHMSISFSGKNSSPVQYWTPDFKPDHSLVEADWIVRVDDTIRDSVKAHLVSDVPFGVFLSGGVDSSLVLAYMSDLLDEPIHAFTIGFEDPDFDETGFAALAARKCNAAHHVKYLNNMALSLLPKIVKHHGDLFGDSSAIPMYYLSRFAREDYKMVLSGDGADEMFAGYWSHMDWMAYYDNNRNSPPDPAYWLQLVSQMTHQKRRDLWREEYRKQLPPILEVFEKELSFASKFTLCNQAQYLDLKSYLPNVILTKVDIASMMHGLEVRTPFIDVELFELISTIPENINVHRDPGGSWHGKSLLKKVAERYFPAEFLNRPKQGFAPPLADWLLDTKGHDVQLLERLCGHGSKIMEYFDPVAIQRLISTRSAKPLWLLLVLEEWLTQTQDRSPA